MQRDQRAWKSAHIYINTQSDLARTIRALPDSGPQLLWWYLVLSFMWFHFDSVYLFDEEEAALCVGAQTSYYESADTDVIELSDAIDYNNLYDEGLTCQDMLTYPKAVRTAALFLSERLDGRTYPDAFRKRILGLA